MPLTIERLQELLAYDQSLGVFTWRCDMGSRAKAGDVAGTATTGGKWIIGVDGQHYYLTQLVTLLETGVLPLKRNPGLTLTKNPNAPKSQYRMIERAKRLALFKFSQERKQSIATINQRYRAQIASLEAVAS